jgi:hypothetical protein
MSTTAPKPKRAGKGTPPPRGGNTLHTAEGANDASEEREWLNFHVPASLKWEFKMDALRARCTQIELFHRMYALWKEQNGAK